MDVLHRILFYVGDPKFLPESAVLEGLAGIVNDMGQRGAWDHPERHRRMEFYFDLEKLIGKAYITSYFKDRLKGLLRVPVGWEEELEA